MLCILVGYIKNLIDHTWPVKAEVRPVLLVFWLGLGLGLGSGQPVRLNKIQAAMQRYHGKEEKKCP